RKNHRHPRLRLSFFRLLPVLSFVGARYIVPSAARRMPDPLHHRRSIRLKEHDYSLPGAYFVTLCAAEKRCIFGHIIGHGMVENQTGKIVRKYWMEIPAHFPNAELDA